MDSKELRGLYEAYTEVCSAQEDIEEGLRTKIGDKVRKHTNQYAYQQGIHNNPGWLKKPEKRAALNKAVRDDIKKNPKAAAKYVGQQIKKKVTGRQPKTGITGTVENLELDIFDVVLEFLQVEGFAETLEEAEWMMANELDAEDIESILEAEGSYGQTPKARQAMGKLVIARREKPASEYSKKGEKTKKVKEIEKHTRRIDNGPDVGNRGKKSTKPRYSGMLGKSGRGKLDQDSRDHARDSAVEYTSGGNKPGPGTVTKNPKKLRKQKAMGEID